MTAVTKDFWGANYHFKDLRNSLFFKIRTLKLRKIQEVHKVLNSVKQQLKIFSELQKRRSNQEPRYLFDGSFIREGPECTE